MIQILRLLSGHSLIPFTICALFRFVLQDLILISLGPAASPGAVQLDPYPLVQKGKDSQKSVGLQELLIQLLHVISKVPSLMAGQSMSPIHLEVAPLQCLCHT